MTSIARIAPITPNSLEAGQRQLYETLARGPRGPKIVQPDGSLFGPFNVLLLSPQAGDRMQALGLAVQRETELSARAREATILAVAHRRACHLEWDAHRPVALDAGLTDADIMAIAEDSPPPDADDTTRTALSLAGILLDRRSIDDDEFARFATVLGERQVLETCLLVGYYDALCNLFALFGLDD